MIVPNIIHLLFPFVSYQFSLIVYIISLANIISRIGVVMKNPAYCGTAESPVILSGNFVFIQIFRDLADTPSVSGHLENLTYKFCIFIRNQISRLVFLISKTAVQLPHRMTLSVLLLNRRLSQPSGIFAFCLGKCTHGVSIKVDDEIVTGLNRDNFDDIFAGSVLAKLGRKPE